MAYKVNDENHFTDDRGARVRLDNTKLKELGLEIEAGLTKGIENALTKFITDDMCEAKY